MCPRWCGLPHAQMHSYALRILLAATISVALVILMAGRTGRNHGKDRRGDSGNRVALRYVAAGCRRQRDHH